MTIPQDREAELERFRAYLYYLARTHLHPRHQARIDASDLVQQTLLDAHLRAGEFRGDGDKQLVAWLRRILINNLADAIRHHGRAKRDVRRQRSLEEKIEASFSRLELQLVDAQATPSEAAAHREDLLRLPGALDQLPSSQREAIVLHHLKGMSLAEVSKVLDRSEPAIAGLLYRGLRRLNAILSSDLE